MSVGDAEQLVADEFVISVDNLRYWKKTVGKSTDERIQAIIKSYTQRTLKFAPDPPMEKLLAEMKRVAEIYKKAKSGEVVKKT